MEKIEEIIGLIDRHEKEKTQKQISKFIKKWPWFMFFCVMGILLGFLYFKNSPDMYHVKSRILIISQDNSLNNVIAFDNPISSFENNKNIENQIGILRSYTLYRKALRNLNWNVSWYRKEPLYKADLYNKEPFDLIIPPNAINTQGVPVEIEIIDDFKYKVYIKGETNINGFIQKIDLEQEITFGESFTNQFFNFVLKNRKGNPNENYLLVFNNLDAMTSKYLASTQIKVEEENSDIISVGLVGESKQKQADFINELNNVFIKFGMENRFKSSEKSLEFIEAQLTRIKETLGTAEENFSNYRRNNQIMNLGQEAQLVYVKLEEIEQEKYLTQLQIDYYVDLQQYLDDSKKIEEMVNPSVVGITDPNINNLLTKLMEFYSRREVLSYSVQEKNPSFIILEKEIMIARDALSEIINNQLKATESKMASLQERYNSVQSRLKNLPETEKKLISIQREFDLNNELYTYMLQKRAEASISKASIAPEVQVIDPAMVESSVKVGPSLVKNVGIGFFGGLLLPFIFITLTNFFNSKIESKEEVEKSTQIPVFDGIIKHRYKEKLPVVFHPRSGIAESFRGVKSNINTLLDQSHCKVISVNSLIPGEGKSFVSSNLAATLAQYKMKTLLIGADMHKPSLHLYFGVKEAVGLASFFSNGTGIDEIIAETTLSNLHLIQAGTNFKNQSVPVYDPKLHQLVETARGMYDFIIIDNAPLMLIPDAILTSKISDLSLFILRINYSYKNQIKQINKMVSFNKIKQAAIVANDLPTAGYGYGHKYYKKGYGEYKSKMNIA